MAESATFEVRRLHFGITSGRYGNAALYDVDDAGEVDAGVGHTGVHPETILGRRLPTGTRVRVTVEVLDEPDASLALDENPWGPPYMADWAEYEALCAWRRERGLTGWINAAEIDEFRAGRVDAR